jgi:hypothetical protein
MATPKKLVGPERTASLQIRLQVRRIEMADPFATHEGSEKSRLLYESTEALLKKIRDCYGWNPPDRLLWGIDITHR